MTTEPTDMVPREAPLAELERALIAEFVRAHGHDPLRLGELSAETRAHLLKEASIYASAKLTEVESRARFVHEIHDIGPRGQKSGAE